MLFHPQSHWIIQYSTYESNTVFLFLICPEGRMQPGTFKTDQSKYTPYKIRDVTGSPLLAYMGIPPFVHFTPTPFFISMTTKGAKYCFNFFSQWNTEEFYTHSGESNCLWWCFRLSERKLWIQFYTYFSLKVLVLYITFVFILQKYPPMDGWLDGRMEGQRIYVYIQIYNT